VIKIHQKVAHNKVLLYINKYLPVSRPKRFWKSLTNYSPLTLSQDQRRQAALRWRRSQYAQNASQIRARNAQQIALALTSNLKVAEEARLRNSDARSQRRRSERTIEEHWQSCYMESDRGKSRTPAHTGRWSARKRQVEFWRATTRAVAKDCWSCYLEIDRGK